MRGKGGGGDRRRDLHEGDELECTIAMPTKEVCVRSKDALENYD